MIDIEDVKQRLGLALGRNNCYESREELWYMARNLLLQMEKDRKEIGRLKWRLNHQTEDDMAACRLGMHSNCGAVSPGIGPE